MKKERLYRTRAVVLKRTDLGEADRLLTIYTRDLGKLRVVAKGIRKPTSRKAGHLEPFMYSQLLIARGRTLDLVTQAETVEGFRAIREDLRLTSYAYYIVELLDKFTAEEDENAELFDLLLFALRELEKVKAARLLLRFYELRLLAEVGYRPELFNCVHCQQTIVPEQNFYSVRLGGVICPKCHQLPGLNKAERGFAVPLNALKILRYIQSHDYVHTMRLKLREGTHRAMERILQQHIAYLLERRLQSVEFLRLVKE